MSFGMYACGGSKNSSDEMKNVTFTIESPDLDANKEVYISGSLEELGYWSPNQVKLSYVGGHKWSIDLMLPEDEAVEYKFTLGSWENEGADANGLPLPNFYLNSFEDSVANHSIYFWKDGDIEPQGQITGHVEYMKNVEGEGILPRDVIIWLPEDYDEHQSKKYPVLYMHDGQNIIDPKTSSFGVDWQVDETVTDLISKEELKSVIVVGVYNTVNRTDEYTPGEKGTAYMEFMAHKLKPMIDKKFRTLQDRKNTYIGGSSAGGIMAFMLAWEYPDIYSGAICMSPAFKIEQIDYVKDVKSFTGEKKPLKLYIDNGGKGLEIKLQPGIDEMMSALAGKGYVIGDDLMYVIDPEAEHFESAWAERMPKALKFVVGK
ncbi:phosphonate ABC transporter ATP-binding protein [Aureibacter tunicatorum]|nr:phosphonate ABC transporter ATP-binding protein [Aureibacter tunicatorum]